MFIYFWLDDDFNLKRYVIVSMVFVVFVLGLSFLICDLGVVFELVGVISVVVMVYILLFMCYIKLMMRSWRIYLVYGIVVFGMVVMIISVI